jgi:putative endonuclease
MTTEPIDERLKKHNFHLYGSTYTSKTNDWEIFITLQCETVSQAMKIEKHIKSMKSKIYIENLKKYPDIIQKILKNFKDI